MSHVNRFPSERIPVVVEALRNTSEKRFAFLSAIKYEDPVKMLLVSIFLGTFGVDRFMMNENALGVLKLLTLGGLGIWTVVDFLNIKDKIRRANLTKLLVFSDSMSLLYHD